MTVSRPLRLALGPSRFLAGLILAFHAAAALSAILVFEPGYGAPLGVLLVALGVVSAWERALLRSEHSICAIEISESGGAILERANGTRVEVQIGPRRHVSQLWVAMAAHGTSRVSLFVVRDMVGASAFRALRMWALWGRWPRPAGDALAR